MAIELNVISQTKAILLSWFALEDIILFAF